ncbi:MAG TPA: NUDIX hydrolase [Anaerolineales bacterium]|nr:NUDIX hydrolase [Anaerolineales bacterium]
MKAERLARQIVYESPWVNLYLDTVRFPNGHVIEQYHMLDFTRAAVAAIVEDDAGNVIFVRVHRYTTGLTEWELPAGGMEDGESVFEAARREVREETGYDSQDHRLLYSYYPMPGSANKFFHIVHCKALGQPQEDIDANEVSGRRWLTKDEARQMIKDHATSDGYTLTALLLWLQETPGG